MDALTAALPRSFNPQFDSGDYGSILNGLEPALGLALLDTGPLGLN